MLRHSMRSATARLSRSAIAPVARRQATVTPLSHRMASSSSGSTAQAAKETVKSDTPWAIGSLLIFGSAFFYITAPPSLGGKGHGGHGGHGKEHNDEEEDVEEEDHSDKYSEVSKIEEKPGDDAPSGSKALAKNSLNAEESHFQKPTKSAADLHKADDTTFQKGVSAAKEGHSDSEKRISDPKKVVAAAHTERQDKKSAKESKDKEAKDAKDAEDNDDGDDDKDGDDDE